ncbi:MAG: hypothetical protein NZ889_00045 [Candidatus Pacearchaeota archaeon]|nr:hypothetical protein [Candidatus Pacearchaeota archaeon]
MNFKEALEELRKKNKKRNFDQTLELIINLKDFNIKQESFNLVISLPHPFKKKKITAFLESNLPYKILEKVITKADMEKISKREMKKIIKKSDFFIANTKLMPLIAMKFGKLLGSSGKMPDPAAGCIISKEDEKTIKEIIERLNHIEKIRVKEQSIKLPVGKESMEDEKLLDNIKVAFNTIIEKLPKKEKNVKNVILKFTMSPWVQVK